jgi:hypothetical protein
MVAADAIEADASSAAAAKRAEILVMTCILLDVSGSLPPHQVVLSVGRISV